MTKQARARAYPAAGKRHRRQSWEVIVEPDFERELLVVITAYPVEPGVR